MLQKLIFILLIVFISSTFSTNRILYGEYVKDIQPFMANLLIDNGWIFHAYELVCGAVIFNKRYVVTAAHCLIHDQPTIVGTNGLNLHDMGTYHKIERKIRHPHYDETNGLNDIGLVKTETEMPNVLSLSETPDDWNRPIIAYGWGWTLSNLSSDYLKQLNLQMVSDIWPCNNNPDAREGLFSCFITYDDKDRAAPGDSGSPVILKAITTNERDVLLGVLNSYSDPIKYKGRVVFSMKVARFSYYYPWLVEIVSYDF